VKLSSAIMLGMNTLDLSGNDFNCDILGVAANAVGIPRAVWTKESIHERNESILDQWPWLEKQIPVEGKDYYQTRFVELSGRFDGEGSTLGDLLNYIRSIEPECGECNYYDCICVRAEEFIGQFELGLPSQDEDKEGLCSPSEKKVVDCKAARQPKDVPQAALESAPPPPATSPISQDAAAEFDRINLDALPPSMRRAMLASRLRIRASIEETDRRTTMAVESPKPAIEISTKKSLWQRAKRSGLSQLDIWKRTAQSWFGKLTLTQILLLAILVVLVAILYVVWQRSAGYQPYFRSTPRSHHYYPG
jgi:hypothetical protein